MIGAQNFMLLQGAGHPRYATDNQSKINVVSSLKYLGIHLDDKLLFKEHIDFLHSKLSRFVGILYEKFIFHLFTHN